MYALAIFLPLIGAVIAGFGGRWIGDRGSQVVTSGCMLLSAIFGCIILVETGIGGKSQTVELLSWINSGLFQVNWSLRFDTLTAVMVFVVTVVSSMVHIYSIGYMSHDPHIPRFMSYLSFFTFFMLMLVTSDNLLQMFFGWEGVGLCSYLLIGFWYEKPEANAAAIKAFLVNRVGDFGFALGIMGVFLMFNSISFETIFALAPGKAEATIQFLGFEAHALTTLCILLFIGAMGKSAQLGLHTWLPDAMEGPTPVSALIHAATMVTAGVFMVARLSPLFEYAPDALTVVTIVGATTCLFAATVALTQTDIKRVIAYSTCSQLGYMFFACGVSAYSAGIFHLTTHAFFKALLFLGAGSVIHAMSSEQDMRRMGGIWKMIPVTYSLMWIGSLALAGLPFFAGFYSKDIVLEAAFGAHTTAGMYAFWFGIIAAILTAFYSWRLIIMTFHGESRADEKTLAHVHESPKVMIAPLLLLALGALFSGYWGYEFFVGDSMKEFWGASIYVLPGTNPIEAAHHVPMWVKLLPIVVAVVGIAAAYYAYMINPGLPGIFATRFQVVYRFLFNKWYFDQLYDFLFVRPAHRLGKNLWKDGDGAVIDGLGPDGVAAAARYLAQKVASLQSGYLYHYAFAMLIGVAGIVTWYLVAGSGG
ncbi:MAG: NADH-quinone oxidoreductase subunit L [Alphaproteobacteria bacterium MarineAlpha11_Bin1]|mgnify:CR=1 FL=1|nr:MAG: NADH-quinone oxidoreductase subunit L [Alphaproteobacteria bacterium MarineAlpha11_Bin1]